MGEKRNRTVVIDIDELESIITRTVREEVNEAISKVIQNYGLKSRDYYLDEEGYLVFKSENEYSDYLNTQKDKFPSEIRAYFLDEQGYKCFYDDESKIPLKEEFEKDLEDSEDESNTSGDKVWNDLRNLGVDV